MISYFSKHYLEDTRSGIVGVNAGDHEHDEENLCGEQHAVVKERMVRMLIQAKLRLR
jgi:hypothetical protein